MYCIEKKKNRKNYIIVDTAVFIMNIFTRRACIYLCIFIAKLFFFFFFFLQVSVAFYFYRLDTNAIPARTV